MAPNPASSKMPEWNEILEDELLTVFFSSTNESLTVGLKAVYEHIKQLTDNNVWPYYPPD